MLALITGSITSGQVVSRLGRYKMVAIAGLAIMTAGLFLLSGMHSDTTRWVIVRNMIVVGVGLGLTMPIYTLAVQNSVDRRMLGVATAATQFFRQIGGTVGTAIFTSLMLTRYHEQFNAGVPAGVPTEALAAFDNPLQLAQILPQLQQQFGQTPAGAQLLTVLLANVRESLVYAIQGSFLLAAASLPSRWWSTSSCRTSPSRSGAKRPSLRRSTPPPRTRREPPDRRCRSPRRDRA